MTTTTAAELTAAVKERLAAFGAHGTTDAQIAAWVKRTLDSLAVFRKPEAARFHLEEVLHYLTPDRVRLLCVRSRDRQVVREAFDAATRTTTTTVAVEPGAHNKRCRKCRSQDTETMMIQTRSADEPTSEFVSCLNCGHRWREV